MSRTPEETARLAATVTVETIYGDVGISAKVAMGAARARFHGSDHPRLHALACLAADLAEARAEVAALRREHEAEANAWEREIDVARHQIAALRPKAEAAERYAEAARALLAADEVTAILVAGCKLGERKRAILAACPEPANDGAL